MKFYLKLDDNAEPSVTVVCRKVTSTVKEIEKLCNTFNTEDELLYAYADGEILPLELADVTCFFTKDGKVYVSVGDKEYATKLRIKQVIEMVDDSFVKINQGCVVKVSQIRRFTVSFGGALNVVLKNGYSDYVARRELSNIKRRFGL